MKYIKINKKAKIINLLYILLKDLKILLLLNLKLLLFIMIFS